MRKKIVLIFFGAVIFGQMSLAFAESAGPPIREENGIRFANYGNGIDMAQKQEICKYPESGG